MKCPAPHNLEAAYLDGCGLSGDLKGPLFRTIGRGSGQLTASPFPQANAYVMIRHRATAADIKTKIGNHSFRATGITASKMAAPSKKPPPWRTTPRRAQPSSMTGGATR
ncbi:hypothetical protein [Methylocystis echinoides]|uniref:Uncharacterized protein n=1 Tax=Methylocystis echinoides TaxID=29468 RepID=A0A9W6GZ30_9HYPH|nr:hypothetical protein [Methylocystis echinoides]GLI95741.1 hypothetical protein LMG27198_47330 [Methylocystis echinoides]